MSGEPRLGLERDDGGEGTNLDLDPNLDNHHDHDNHDNHHRRQHLLPRSRSGSPSASPRAKKGVSLSIEMQEGSLALPDSARSSEKGAGGKRAKKERPKSMLFSAGSFKFGLGKKSRSVDPGEGDALKGGDGRGEEDDAFTVPDTRPPPPALPPPSPGVVGPSPRGHGKIGILVLNVQRDFVGKNGALPITDIPKGYVDKINELASLAEWKLFMVASSQHPPNYASFHSNAPATTPFEDSLDSRLIVPDHCVMGSWGAQLAPDLTIPQHAVTVECGLVPEPEDSSPFGTLGANSHESIAEQYVAAAQITDMVVVGVDIDGENFLSTVFALSEQYINVILVKDLCFTVMASDELWPSIEELGAQVETLASVTPFLKKFEDRNPSSQFSEKRFQELMAFTRGSHPDLDALRALIAKGDHKTELEEAHPMTGWYFVHYVSACPTPAAARVLHELLESGVVDIDQHAEIDDMTPIMAAVRATAYDTAAVLVNNQSQGDKLRLARADCYGRTALMYALLARSVGLVELLMDSPKGGKRLLHARDSVLRSVVCLACMCAGREAQDMHAGGLEVLDKLWPLFESREFLDSEGDMAGWTVWNYAVRYNLVKHLLIALTKYTLSTQQQQALGDPNTRPSRRLSDGPSVNNQSIQDISLSDSAGAQDQQIAQMAGGEPTVALGAVLQMQGHDPHATPGGLLAKHMAKSPDRWEEDRLHLRFHTERRGRAGTGGSQVSLATVLARSGPRGQNLLHQATWQRKTDILPPLLDRYQEENMLQEVNEGGLSALDLVAHDINPALPFLLVEGGCTSKHTSGSPMYQLCLKALMLGHTRVFRDMVLSGAYGVKVDTAMLDTITRLAVLRACTASTPGQMYQLAYSCSDCARENSHPTFCFSCALVCHGGHKGLRCDGLQSFHCADPKDKCKCQRGSASLDSPYQSVQVVSATALLNPQQIMASEPAHKGGQRRSVRLAGLAFDSLQPVDTGKALLNKMKSFKSQRKIGLSFQGKPEEPPRHGSGGLADEVIGAILASSSQGDDNFALARQKLTALTSKLSFRDMAFHVLVMSVARTGQEGLVDELVKRVKPDYAVDESLERPLHVAARNGRASICALLKANGARLNATNLIGETPMHLAAQYGHLHVCAVVAHSSNLLRMDALALTPLHHAVRNNRPEVVDFVCKFLRHRAKVPVEMDDLVLPAWSAAAAAAARSPPPRARKNSLGIGLAPRRQTTQSVVLDMAGVNPSVVLLGPGRCEGHATPLHLAVRYGHAQCVRVLMKHGASPIHVDSTGFNPYQTAIWELYITRVKLEQHHQLLLTTAPTTTPTKPSKMRPTRGRSQSVLPNKRFRAPEATDIEAHLRDLNNNIPVQYQTHSLRTNHTLLDALGASPSVERLRKRFAYRKLLTHASLYLLVLLVFLVFSIPRKNTNFFFGRRLEETMERSGWTNVTTMEQSWEWLHANLNSSSALLPPTIADVPFVGVYLLGSVRLRQVRSRDRACDAPWYVGGVVDHTPCLFDTMTPSYELTRALHWDPPLSPDDAPFNATLQQARQWQASDTASTTLDLGRYSSSGYWVDLDLTAHTDDYNARLLALLQSPDNEGRAWLDMGTRLVQVEFAVYNLNMDVFGVVVLSLEHASTGEMSPMMEILSFDLEKSGLNPYPSLGFKIAAGLVTLYNAAHVLGIMVRKGLVRSLFMLGCWFDIALGALALSVLMMDVWVSRLVDNVDINVHDTSRFQSLLSIVRLIQTEGFVIGVLILLLWLRLIKYSVLTPKFGRVTFAFMNTIKNFEVVAYLLFMFFVVLGFLMAFRLSFNQSERTRSYESAFNLLMQMMMGEWNDEVFATLPFAVRTGMYVSFMIVVAVVFINLFISVLSEVYPREKKRAAVQCNDNLTVLIEREFILNTHTFRHIAGGASHERLRRYVKHFLVSPLVTNASLVLRLFDARWNLDVPKREFGWEKGRDVFRRNLLVDASGMEEE